MLFIMVSYFLKNFTEKPQKLEGNVDVSEICQTSCTLTWPKAEEINISGYIIQKQDVTKQETWTTLEKITDFETTTIQIRDLVESHQYLFRVATVNEYGLSEYIETEQPVLIKAPFGKS